MGVPVFGNGLFYVVALKDYVDLGFSATKLTKEELMLFDGGGKTARDIKIKSLNNLDIKQIKKLLNLVYRKQR